MERVSSGRIKQGFTLIELLITTSLLFMLLLIGGYAYQFFDLQWRKDLDRAKGAFSEFQQYELLSGALAGITPYLVNQDNSSGFYFLGDASGFTAYTQAPVFHQGAPAVIRVFREKQPDGLFQLVYEEASLQQTALIDGRQQLPFDYRLVLLKDLPSLSFSYYAQSHVDEMALEQTQDIVWVYQWFDALDGMKVLKNPEQIQIDINGFLWRQSMPARANLLRSRDAMSRGAT